MPVFNRLVTTSATLTLSNRLNNIDLSSFIDPDQIEKARLTRVTIPKEASAFTEQLQAAEVNIAQSTRINPPELPINNAVLKYGLKDQDRWWDETTEKPDTSALSFSLPLTLTNGMEVTYHRVAPSEPNGTKSYAIETPDGAWHPISRMRPDLLPFFNQEVIKTLDVNQTLIVVEGVPATQFLMKHNIKAVGTLSGVIQPSDAVLEPLVDKRIILWPDNDDVGVHYMAQMTQSLKRLGAKDIRVLQWANGPKRGDAANFVGNKAKLNALIKTARPWPISLLRRANKPLRFAFPPSPDSLRLDDTF